MITYYISGPMRGIDKYNFPQFMEVENALHRYVYDTLNQGEWEIFNPARNFDGDTTRDVTEYMQVDCELVLKSDVLVLLPGWENSEGAQREVALATWTGKRFVLAIEPGVRLGAVDPVPHWQFVEVEVPTAEKSPRADVLTEAGQLITGDRNNQYGPPTQDFARTAAMATGFGFQVNGKPLEGHHVAIFQILLKMSRLAWTPTKRDSWVDTAGYAGCGYECAVEAA